MNTYTFHIGLYDLACLGTIFIGFTFTLLLWFTKGNNRIANRFLGLALAIITMWTVRILSLNIQLATYITYWKQLPFQYSLALGPLIFFYVLKVTQPKYKFRVRDLLHFSPLLLELGAQLLEIEESEKTGIPAYYTMSFHQLNPILLLLAFISVSIYLYASHQLIRRFYRELQFIGVDRYRDELRWLDNLLMGLGLVLIPFIVVNYLYYHYQLGVQIYYPIYLVLVSAIIWIAAMVFLKREMNTSPRSAQSLKLPSPPQAKHKGIWLKKVVKSNRHYENPELSLSSLAAKLDLTTHELSWIINTGLKKTFNDFINEFRVAEVVRKMQDPAYDHLTLLGIAYESGFNSSSTFHRIFKQMTGNSPAEYKTDRKNDLPSYNLGYHKPSAAVISYQRAIQMWSHDKLNCNIMFKNYLKIAWRNLVRNKSYAAINIVGLSVGIAACLLIFLVVRFETSFDNFHKNKDHIYRVVSTLKTATGINYETGVPMPTAAGLRNDYSGIMAASIFKLSGQVNVLNNNGLAVKKFKEDDVYFTEPQFFNVFDFDWLAGDKKTALNEANTVVLTQECAEKYFGSWTEAIGKTINYENKNNLKVTGILKNIPENTDFKLKIVVSYATLKNTDDNSMLDVWGGIFSNHYCFAALPGNMSEKQLNDDLAVLVEKHKPAAYKKDGLIAIPLTEMHYDTRFGLFSGHTFSKDLITALSLIGLFLLIIACVNFINMATAQAVNRSKEVGIRKVLGSNRKQLVLQFISETFIIAFFAVIVAIGMAGAALPFLNHLLGIHISSSFLIDNVVVLFLSAVVFGVTICSGLYPAIILSGFNPIAALKNKITTNSVGGISLRRGLVILQFSIAQVLVIGTLVIINQMDYFKNYALGFDKNAIVNVFIPSDNAANAGKLDGLSNQLLQLPGVKDVSFSFAGPSDNTNWSSNFKYNNSKVKTDFKANLKWADAEYFKLYNMQFVAGRPYAKSDTVNGYVVNESMLKKLGITDPKEALGKRIDLWDDPTKLARICGVVKDFNVSALREPIPPVLMGSWKGVYQNINIKLQGNNIKQTIAAVEKLWNSTFPDYVYQYQFVDEKVAKFYDRENQLSTLYKIFAGLAVFISCLGLYGLVSFMAVQRTKEVGIRKTLGASVSHIVYLFSKEFTLLIIIAFGISAPLGWYFMNKWLEGFAYKITLGPWTFIIAIAVSVIIAWITVGYKAIRAALANPVNSLRSE